MDGDSSQLDLIDPKWLNWLKQHNLNTATSRITMNNYV
jgi:hypothetical protein